MIRALYAAASGMVAQTHKHEIIANNIANVQTTAFKRERATGVSFADTLNQTLATSASTGGSIYPASATEPVLVGLIQSVDYSQGAISRTENPLDLAIDGPGFFEVAGQNGVQYTRAGNLTLGSNRELCTLDGARVMGSAGPIRLPNGKLEILSDGSILVNGQQIDKLKIVNAQPGRTRIIQGALENSNVNVVEELTEMITGLRTFEANQRVVSSVDHTLDKLINEVGRV
ncbi:MAG: flagellar hook-basal body protein [Armatimonadota bacterium]